VTIRHNSSGLFSVALRACTVMILKTFLPDAGLTAWVRGYRPEERVMWQPMTLALRPGGGPQLVDVRGTSFDIRLPVEKLIDLLPEFEGRDLDLHLMSRPVPDTLTLGGLTYDAATRVLIANGMVGHFDLPHRMEVAVLSSPSEETLRRWLKGPLSEWVL
jgi:hypothetical protein